MKESSATVEAEFSLSQTLPAMAVLLAGVPLLTALVMIAMHYVASGTL